MPGAVSGIHVFCLEPESREWRDKPSHDEDSRIAMTETATSSATFTIGSEADARRAVDVLTECLSEDEVAVAAFEQPGGDWDVTLHFAQAPDQAIFRDLVVQAAGEPAAQTLSFAIVAPRDWVKSSLEGLQPVEAGRFIVHGAHDRARVQPNKIGIEIEAALAFGTGHHGTTRGCLLLLGEVLRARQPNAVLDLGTGTGVLGIAAARALRRPVLASDIDAASVAIARDNARLNGAGHLMTVIHATGFAGEEFGAFGPFDLVLANILANPLKALAPAMARHMTTGGLAILSGLLPPQAAGVIAAYRAAGFVLVRQLRLDGWSSLLMRRV
jgi:ribosomal protein L11 methyltransferase